MINCSMAFMKYCFAIIIILAIIHLRINVRETNTKTVPAPIQDIVWLEQSQKEGAVPEILFNNTTAEQLSIKSVPLYSKIQGTLLSYITNAGNYFPADFAKIPSSSPKISELTLVPCSIEVPGVVCNEYKTA